MEAFMSLIRCLHWNKTIAPRVCVLKRVHARVLVSRGEMRHWVWKCCDCLKGQRIERRYNKDGKNESND